MRTIKPMDVSHVDAFCTIATNSFCEEGFSAEVCRGRRDFIERMVTSIPGMSLHGMFEGDRMIGGMNLTEYTMNIRSLLTGVGGIRAVAVDLLHRKEGAAKALIEYACNHFRNRGYFMAILYPFRTDFYKKMGLGFGTEVREYRMKTEYFPANGAKEHVLFALPEDREAILDCYSTFVRSHHGMMEKLQPDLRQLFRSDQRIVVYKREGKVLGYIHFSFASENEFRSNLLIHEWIYVSAEAFMGLSAFIHSLADQFEYILVKAQDEHFHYMVTNPAIRPSDQFQNALCTVGVGIMYRVIDITALFTAFHAHNFNGQTCRLQIELQDPLIPSHTGRYRVDFVNGRAGMNAQGGYEVGIRMNVAEFSSLFMGLISFERLVQMGLAEITKPEYIPVVTSIFLTASKPVCTTYF